MHRELLTLALVAALFAVGCARSEPSPPAPADGSTPVCSGTYTPDVSFDLGCDILAGGYPCTYCLQSRGETFEGGPPAADVYTVYPGVCLCP
ncbi:MAG: hypothetical protein KF729_08195 [Sandaracinaceae bacterium]|nr:hypothetical protein [Sandaracinaceae bacterium]